MVYNGKSDENGGFRGTPVSGNLHIFIYVCEYTINCRITAGIHAHRQIKS
jgi:hypothetical protein